MSGEEGVRWDERRGGCEVGRVERTQRGRLEEMGD